MGRPPPQIWGPSPQSRPKSPPMIAILLVQWRSMTYSVNLFPSLTPTASLCLCLSLCLSFFLSPYLYLCVYLCLSLFAHNFSLYKCFLFLSVALFFLLSFCQTRTIRPIFSTVLNSF